MATLQEETDAYLKKIRKTIQESRALMEQAELRIAETDRLLEQQGLTREQVRNLTFTDEQKAVVNAELERRGMAPLDFTEPERGHPIDHAPVHEPGQPLAPEELAGDAENRRRKFSAMMGTIRL